MKKRLKPTVLREKVFDKIKNYGQKAGDLGQQVRHLVFGFRQRSTAHVDRHAFPVKLLVDHRLVQRRRAFQQSGGTRSSIALHALDKVRKQQQP
ncbi:MAG TPA: hypothetical protein P5526_02905 [Anaerolineae bacterium]|nr:hypothetical protein [Anaerolineae bacterium]MCB0177963.1 hypothetical protein [Anaerolineae bacterium]MCB0224622.1 hypothetical protein [Anaerolineae bacterium]MCB9108539.1 hypothetical protein [Anaerolineales bacterium]HRV91093.1 hypothetical protein [Anaerolineae bacterium]